MKKAKIYDKIRFKSGNEFVILSIDKNNICDLKALKPQFEWMPDFLPVYFAIKIEEYDIIEDSQLNDAQIETVFNWLNTFKGLEKTSIPMRFAEHFKSK